VTTLPPGTPRQSDCVDVHEDAVDAGASPAPATTRNTHFPPILRTGDSGWMDSAGKTRSGFAFTFGVDLDRPIVSPYRAKQRAARRVRMARKKRRGWA
jgi:hypothetical protein